MQSKPFEPVRQYGTNVDVVVLADDQYSIDDDKKRFIFPSLTPNLNNNDIHEETIPNRLQNTFSITTTNYIELSIPKHLFTIEKINIEPNLSFDDGYVSNVEPKVDIVYKSFEKGQKFIIVYIGETKHKPNIVGVYNEL